MYIHIFKKYQLSLFGCLLTLLAGCGVDTPTTKSGKPELPFIQADYGKARPNYLQRQTTWKFAVLTDSQGRQMNLGKDRAPLPLGAPRILLDAAVNKMMQADVEVALFTGDLTQLATSAELQDWLDAFSPYLQQGGKLYPVRGNHELPNYRYENMRGHIEGKQYHHLAEQIMPMMYRDKLQNWRAIVTPLIPKENCFDDDCLSYSVMHNNILFIGIDTYFHFSRPNRQQEYQYGIPEWRELSPWLHKTFDNYAARADRIVIFLHESLAGRSFGHTGQINHGWKYIDALDNGIDNLHQKLSELFTGHEVMVFAGHDHQYSRSLIYPQGTQHGRSFMHVISGNLSFKSYANRSGYYPGLERGLAQDNFTPKYAEYPGIENAATLIIVEISGQRMRYQYYRANHSWDHADMIAGKTWQNPQWVLVDQFDMTADATSKVVAAGESYAMQSDTPDVPGYYGTRAAIIDGHNHTFDAVEASGLTYNNDVTDVHYQIDKGQRLNLYKLVHLSWYAEPDGTTESDIVHVDGLNQQDCTFSRYWGAAEINTECSDRQTGNSNHILDNDTTDAYVLTISVAAWANPETLIPAVWRRGEWQPVVQQSCHIRAVYQPEFLYTKPDGLPADCAAGSWGYDESKRHIWMVLHRQGAFALVKRTPAN